MTSRPRALLPIATLCFFLSGVAGLLYEVVWMRLLGLVFGHTIYAVTTVLAAYMGGLALGSFLFGRLADRLRRPLRAYAALEALIGLWCVATPLLFRAADAGYAAIHRSFQPSAGAAGLLHFAFSAALLLPPTALMGATLPVLARAVVDAPRLAASQVGTLYAVNTWGAVAGTLLTGFVLLPGIGLSATVWLGVGLNLLVAAVAFLADRGAAAAEAGPAPAPAPGPDRPRLDRLQVAVALAAIGISGAASMALEISWTRALALAVGSSTYAFSAMLATFLVGLALGALLASRLLRRRPLGLAAFGAVEAAIALAALAVMPLFGRLPEGVLWVLERTGLSHRGAVLAQFALSFLTMIGPTLLVGATFPLVAAALARGPDRLGRDVGRVYAANTVGTILGSVGAGFLLVPHLGIQRTLVVASSANLVAALAVLAVAREWGRRPRLIAGAAAGVAFAAAVGLLPSWDRRLMTSGASVYAPRFVGKGAEAFRATQERRQLLFYAEGITTTVAVQRDPRTTSLSIDGKIDASTGIDMPTQLFCGHVGALLHPEAKRALVIGLASGVTVGAVAQHPLEVIDVAELEPAMVEASRFFVRENRGALADRRVRVLEGDGRQILATAPAPYDLIVSEPSNPWIAGIANLFTREFYRAARRQLSERGVMVQWLQAYSIDARDMQMVVRTFQEVFPHVSIWKTTPGDFLLVATPAPLELDLGAIERRLRASPGAREDFERFGWSGERLLDRFFLGEEDARRYAAGAPVNTDDRPILEFSAPRALYGGSASDNEAHLRSFRTAARPALRGLDPAVLDGTAGRLRRARAHVLAGEPQEALLQLGRLAPAALGPPERLERARLLVLLGRWDEAGAELGPLARERPGDAEISGWLLAAELLRHPANAQELRRAMQSLPGVSPFAEGPDLIGNFLLATAVQGGLPQVYPVALAFFEAALRIEPGSYEIQNNRGNALFEMGRFDEATDAYRRSLELFAESSRARFNLGLALEAQGLAAEASREYAEAARLEPGWEPPRQRLSALGAAR